jgi:hypothetical protein
VGHSLTITDETKPEWVSTPQDLLAQGLVASNSVKVSLVPDGSSLHIEGDESKNQLISQPILIKGQTDYLLRLPVRIEQGRMMISVEGVGDNHQYASAIVEPQDWKTIAEQPVSIIELPFVSGSNGQARIVFANAGAAGMRPILQIGQPQLYALGPASFTWTRIPRAVLRLIQKLFVTAVMLPLFIIGLILLIRARRPGALVLLVVVPAYYLSVQSALHTEYRYVLAIHYFLFILVAFALHQAAKYLWSSRQKIPFLNR